MLGCEALKRLPPLTRCFAVASFALIQPACDASSDNPGAGGGGAGTQGGSANAGALSGGGRAGSSVAGTISAGTGTAGSAAGTPGSAGMSSSTAGAQSGGGGTAAGAGGSTAGAAGAASGAAGATSGAAGAAAGAGGGMAGSSGSLKGGSSAAFICAKGATYGNPLMGMGAITTISAPTMGPVTYFAFIEGPVWIGSASTLFFSDNASSPQERIFKLAPPATVPAVFMDMSGSNGLAVDNEDKLLLADQRGKRIVRVDPMTAQVLGVVVPAGSYTPNDLIMRSDGNLYFTDPARGFYRVSPAGAVSPAITQVSAPNGIVLSPDEAILYVGDVGNRTISKFAVAADGSVDGASKASFVTAMGNTVDGMAVDCAGNVYASTQTGVEVYSPTGMLVGTVPTGEASNVTFGGADRKTLYATSRSVLKSVTLAVPGLPD